MKMRMKMRTKMRTKIWKVNALSMRTHRVACYDANITADGKSGRREPTARPSDALQVANSMIRKPETFQQVYGHGRPRSLDLPFRQQQPKAAQ